MKKTAVHELFLKWLSRDLTTEDFEQAKEMEKEKIKEAWIQGGGYSALSQENDRMLSEQYYKQTYGDR